MLKAAANKGLLSIEVSCEKLRRCRVCLKVTTDKENDFVDILEKCFPDEGDGGDGGDGGGGDSDADGSQNFLEIFNECTKLKVTELEIRNLQHNLPDGEWSGCHFLCGTCKAELISAYRFINKAILSNDLIIAKLNSLKFTKPQPVPTTNAPNNVELVDDYKSEIDLSNVKDEFEFYIEKSQNCVLGEELEVFFTKSRDNKPKAEVQKPIKSSSQYEFIEIDEDAAQNWLSTKETNKPINVQRDAEVCESIEIASEEQQALGESVSEEIGECNVYEAEYLEEVETDAVKDSKSNNTRNKKTASGDIECIEENYSSGEDTTETVDESPKKKFSFKCFLCQLDFQFERELLTHNDDEHGSESSDGRIRCEKCDKFFINKHTLRMHSRSQHEGCEFIDCPQCGRMVLRNFYKTHLKRHQHKTKVYCEECPSSFSTAYQLRQHRKIKHEGLSRQYRCDKCERGFDTMQYLRLHQEIHKEPEKRPLFICRICRKAFLAEGNLKYHMSVHQGSSLSCTHCGKGFSRRKDLEVHERFHTKDFKYACEICGRCFGIQSHLNVHLKKHQGVQYQCNVCSKKFHTTISLKEHSFEHTTMPYNCTLCDRGFPSKFKIRRHLKGVHHNLFEGIEYSDRLAEEYIMETDAPTVIDAIEISTKSFQENDDSMQDGEEEEEENKGQDEDNYSHMFIEYEENETNENSLHLNSET